MVRRLPRPCGSSAITDSATPYRDTTASGEDGIAFTNASSALSTNWRVARSAITSSICATSRGSAKRSIWSVMTLVSTTVVGANSATILAPCASSISSTAMLARARPARLISLSSALISPWRMLAVEWFVNTERPCARRSAESMLVVVDLPLDPLTITSPSGKELMTSTSRVGARRLATRPGAALPPPGRSTRIASRTARAARMASAVTIDRLAAFSARGSRALGALA